MFSAIPSLAQATIALAVNAPWLIISYLAYVAGFVCYYARRENLGTSIEAKLVDTQEYTSQPASSKIDSPCSFPVSVSVDESYFKLKPKPESLNVSLEPKILQQIKEKLEHN